MTSSTRFFRWVWRVNAILILVAAGAIVFGVAALFVTEVGARSAWRGEATTGPVVVSDGGGPDLVLRRAGVVEGTDVMRAELVVYLPGAGFSSGGNTEVRNILFVGAGESTARWLLPDHGHVIAEQQDVHSPDEEPRKNRTVATVVLVKKQGTAMETVEGRLLLFDPSGRNIVEVANGVRTMHAAAISDDEVTVLFERDRRLHLARFTPVSLARLHEQAIDVPQLK